MGTTDETVETVRVAGAWAVRVGAIEVGRYAARGLAVDAGARLAATFGIDHVVRYAVAA
jgi:hypothetical protein